MPSGNKKLVEFIGQRIKAGSQNAEHRSPGAPETSAFFSGSAVEKKGENGIFGQVGKFAQRLMEKMESAAGEVNVQELEYQSQQPAGEIGGKRSGGKAKNDPRPN